MSSVRDEAVCLVKSYKEEMMEKKIKKVSAGLVTVLLFVCLLLGCSGKISNNEAEKAPEQETANYGVMTGSTAETFIGRTYPNAKISTYFSIADAFLALSGKKVDYVLTAYTTALNAVRENKNMEIYQKDIIKEESSIAVAKNNTSLLEDIDNVLEQFESDGTLDKVAANWTSQGQDYTVEDIPVLSGANGVLRVAIAADREPMCFVMDGNYRGLDCELIERIAYELDMTVEYQNMQFSALTAALASGKADVIISNMTATEERRESVNFTRPYFANPQVMVARKTGEAEKTDTVPFESANYGLTSVTAQNWLNNTYPEAQSSMFPSAADAVLALQTGKVDYVVSSLAIAEYMMKTDKDIIIAKDKVVDEACSVAVAKNNPGLKKALDGVLEQMEKDGTLEAIIIRWTETEPDDYVPVIVPEASGAGGTLRVAVSPDVTPICFVLDGAFAGIDIELIERAALVLDMKVEFINMQFDALLPALESGKADIAVSDIVDTAERRENVNFTRPYFDNPQVLITRGTDSVKTGGHLLSGLKASFVRTFVTENRWKMIVNGLMVTSGISVLSGIFGFLIGFGLCMLRRLGKRCISMPTAVFIRIIQGTPVVVLLMILYYVIFGAWDIPAAAVSVIGFSVNFGVYVSEMMRTGIDSVDKGQIEAAVALGYSRIKTFQKVTFPQAAKHFLPVFKGEFISMVKMTSVVGYIAVQDLTKVSDIIRSRTLEAFFPLIVTAVLYFMIANILSMALSFIEVGLDPKRRVRKVKGVERV